jgi:hypothetical protein
VEWMHKWGFVSWLVSDEWGGRRGVFILSPQKLAVIVMSRNYRGVPVKPNSGAISLVPTTGQYYWGPSQNSLVKPYRYYRPGIGTTDKGWDFKKRRANVHVLTRFSSHSLKSSPKALLASLGDQFASPLIVRCFLYSNSKSKLN